MTRRALYSTSATPFGGRQLIRARTAITEIVIKRRAQPGARPV